MSANAQDKFSFGTATNPEGRTVEVDRYGIIMDGKHCIPVMGEIHYSRVPEADWLREIRKMKAGGITVIATYVFWIHHEAQEGLWDWSGNRNLHRFLQLCQQEQMPVVLRIGPFCHGEVFQGGFPEWLVQKAQSDPKQFKLRSQAPGFMAATQRFYSNIFAQASDMMWKHGGPIIGVQIENECRGPWPYYMALKDMAVSIGFDAPFYTRTGWPKLNGKEEFGKLLPLYGDYADGFWDRKLTDMPGEYPQAFIMKDTRISGVIATETFGTNQDTKMDKSDLQYPYLTCELGGGMMPAYHRRINMSGNEPFPLAVCKVGSGSNLPGYYMYHGGSNPAPVVLPDGTLRTMAETQNSPVTNYNDMPLISYDFQAPLGEMGQPNLEAYHQTRWFHQFLADWGEELAVSDVDTLSEHYARRGAFEFYNDYVRILKEEGTSYVALKDWKWDGLNISTLGIQPFARTTEGTYFVEVKGSRVHNLIIDGKTYKLRFDKPQVIKGKTFTLLSLAKAKAAFVIDGKMHYAQHGGILYRGDEGKIVEECWETTEDLGVEVGLDAEANYNAPLRSVSLGTQKVAAMPTDKDFEQAAKWELCVKNADGSHLFTWNSAPIEQALSTLTAAPSDYFLRINYLGDCARVYADGKLVMDNFWNGKPMLVRLSDLAGKKVELRILPLGKDYPIYLQQAQRTALQQAESDRLLQLQGIEIVRRVQY